MSPEDIATELIHSVRHMRVASPNSPLASLLEQAAALILEQAAQIGQLSRIIYEAEPWVMELRAHYDREMREAETMTKWIEWERRAIEALKVKP